MHSSQTPQAATPWRLPAEQERTLAGALFNRVWELIRQENRTTAVEDEMVHAAHASRWHWAQVGTALNLAIGEWQVSRVYSEIGRAEPAVHHARRALELAQAAPGAEWLVASACEGLARALAVAGDVEASQEWRHRAYVALEAVTDPRDREIVEADLADLPGLPGAER